MIMKALRLVQYSLGMTAAAGVLAACSMGGSQPGLGAGAPTSQNDAARIAQSIAHGIALTTRAGIVPVQHLTHEKSWMSPDGKKAKALIYAPDYGKGSVVVFSYKKMKEVGEATGFSEPYGACSDSNGNVYVVDYSKSQISEFAYGSTTVERTISDGTGYPIGCSVNPTNGDLAVTNFFDYGSGGGGVLIYPNATGTPTFYPAGFYNWPAGYDPNGNLWMESNDEGLSGNCSSGVCLEELTAGGTQFNPVSFNGTIDFAGAVEWDGQYLGLGDQEVAGKDNFGVLEATVSGSSVNIVNTVTTTDNCDSSNTDAIGWAEDSTSPDDVPGALASQIAFGNLWCENHFDQFLYPTGGMAKKRFFIEEYIYSPTIVAAPKK
jgi:hypothetical protein